MINYTAQQGRIPFDLEVKNADDDKKAFIGFNLSVQRSYKPEGEKYYPEDLLYCKAFGSTAKFIGEHFSKGDFMNIEGEVRRDDDYEKDGQTVKGQLYIHITKVHFASGGKKKDSEDGESEKPAKNSKANDTKPAGKTPGLNPLTGKKGGKSPF